MRTTAGLDWQSKLMADTASNGTGTYAAGNYIALTENATAPAAGDTTLTAELSGSGWTRAQATYAHTPGASTHTLTKTFTSADASARTINKMAVFNASSSGTMCFETLVTNPPVLVSGDAVTLTHSTSI